MKLAERKSGQRVTPAWGNRQCRSQHEGAGAELDVRDGQTGHYAFNVGALADRGYEVQNEECSVGGKGHGPHFEIERGRIKASSEDFFPAITSDRLALVSLSGLKAFRPVFDALTGMAWPFVSLPISKAMNPAGSTA